MSGISIAEISGKTMVAVKTADEVAALIHIMEQYGHRDPTLAEVVRFVNDELLHGVAES